MPRSKAWLSPRQKSALAKLKDWTLAADTGEMLNTLEILVSKGFAEKRTDLNGFSREAAEGLLAKQTHSYRAKKGL